MKWDGIKDQDPWTAENPPAGERTYVNTGRRIELLEESAEVVVLMLVTDVVDTVWIIEQFDTNAARRTTTAWILDNDEEPQTGLPCK